MSGEALKKYIEQLRPIFRGYDKKRNYETDHRTHLSVHSYVLFFFFNTISSTSSPIEATMQ